MDFVAIKKTVNFNTCFAVSVELFISLVLSANINTGLNMVQFVKL